MLPVPSERRAHTRESLGVRVALHIAGGPNVLPALLENISLGGCYFATAMARVSDGALVKLSFSMKPSGVCGATGRVVRCRVGQGFGVQFDEINEAMREFVGTLACTDEEGRSEVAAAITAPDVQIS
jgi:hypothetical protein